MLSSAAPPRLLLLRLSQTGPALAVHGPGSPEAAAAFAGADGEIARLVACLERSGRLGVAALVIVGDHGTVPVHTALAPNVLLADARLVATEAGATRSWRAIARSNGGSAFVYARNDRAALHARRILAAEAARTGAFRIVSATEMLAEGGDPEAWFGLEGDPGYVFVDVASGPAERAAAWRGAGGYLSGRDGMSVGLVAWGRGIRQQVRVPTMRQTDVAPTLARLLGLELGDVAGRVLVGALRAGPAPVASMGDERSAEEDGIER
jgi:arylsulfatase A-like enzyme